MSHKTLVRLVSLVVILASLSASCLALSVTLGYPDIGLTSASMPVSYTASTGTLTTGISSAAGFVLQFASGGTIFPFTGSYNLASNFVSSSVSGGVLAGLFSGGNLSVVTNSMITGTPIGNIAAGSTLIAGNITQLELSGVIGSNQLTLNTLFTGLSGVLAGLYGGSPGGAVQLIINLPVAVSDTLFCYNFNATGQGGSVGPAIPEPASLMLFGSGLLGLGSLFRKRKSLKA